MYIYQLGMSLKSNWCFLLQFLYVLLCHVSLSWSQNNTFSNEDFKCSLPDVTTNSSDLDLSRFRSDFTKVSEVKFPGLIGPLNERLICKIKCIDGNWVGPLCSTTTDGRFQPIFRECVYNGDHPVLLFSFRNTTFENETNFAHGSVITARCKHFGLYKLKGENLLHCHNGEWKPKAPECVPTGVVTNFTGDSPPTIKYTIISGSASVEPAGELFVFPDSTLHLDCIVQHGSSAPEWSWTQTIGQHIADWSKDNNEKETHYRLILSKMSARHSDLYTCASSEGQTNTIVIKVVNVLCSQINASNERLVQLDEGVRLGQSVHFNCLPGYHLNGSKVVTCTGSGQWSARSPTCVETFCPMLKYLSPHLSLVEYNSSYGGRAVFQCSWGYKLMGTPGIECEQNGEWSGKPPICMAIYCPSPILSEHGFLINAPSSTDGKHPVGDLVMFDCEKPYTVVGESSIVCTENGYWSHPPPFCVIANESLKSDTIFVENTTLVHFEE